MVTYVMQAKENYDPANVSLINASTPHKYAFTDQQDLGISFDFVRRKLMYSVAIADADTTTNSTGNTLFDGHNPPIANGGGVDTTTQWNLWIGEKDIDTGVVTFYNAYNVANTVPNGIGPLASGYGVFSSIVNNNTIVLNGVTWTFVTGAPVGNQTQIGTSTIATVHQLALDLNASANAFINVASYVAGAGVLEITYKTTGTVGNSYSTSTGTVGSGDFPAAFLSGGSVGSSDSTWRPIVWNMNSEGNNLPILVDPRTSNVWFHNQSCNLYLLQHSDSFQLKIFPFLPIGDPTILPVYPIGITSDWVFAFENVIQAGGHGSGYFALFLLPPTITAPETTAYNLLPYAWFDYPALVNLSFFRQCLDHSGNFYLISAQPTGTKNIKLWKFTKPTSAPFGGPVVGGGFTDVTPWSGSTGPNTNAANYTIFDIWTFQNTMDRNILMFLPVTNDFVAINKFTQYESSAVSFTASITGTVLNVTSVASGALAVGQSIYDGTAFLTIDTKIISLGTGSGGTGTYNLSLSHSIGSKTMTAATYADTFYDCTYINTSSGTLTFDYHHAFVSGYMRSSWAPDHAGIGNLCSKLMPEFNLYLGMSDYDYGIDYTKRWFLFSCQPVSSGVVDTNSAHTKCVLVQYQFVSGSAPTVLSVFDDSGWTAAYPAYLAAISGSYVVWASTPEGNDSGYQWSYTDLYVGDPGVYDYTTGEFWMSGQTSNMFQLDSTFTPRTAFNTTPHSSVLPPFLVLSASAPPLTAKTSIQLKGRLAKPVPPPPPPIPPPPAPINPFDCLVSVISQYANSPILLTILENFCEAEDPFPLINAFYNYLWNIDTAVGYGLDVWGRIVGVTRVLEIPQGRFFGFEEQLNTTDPFNVSPFFAGSMSGSNYLLSDNAFRLLILVKALANITDGSVKSINTILRTLFQGSGNAYVQDGLNMTMVYTFTFNLTPVQAAIVNQSGVLPRSTGVAATVSVIP